MGRRVGEAKRSVWRRRLGRFARGGQTVAAFCEAEGVTAPTFYHWKRKLAVEASGAGKGPAGASLAAQRTAGFVPVRITGETSGAIELGVGIAIELPNGARVRVPAGNLDAIGAAILAAGRVAGRVETETPRC
jgi:transposase